MRRLAPAFAACLLLAGCVDRPPDPALVEAPRSIVALPADAGGEGAARFVIEAATACSSGPEPVAARANWSVGTPGAAQIEIHVIEPDADQSKLWMRTAAEGQVPLPSWARPGMVFQLRRVDSGEVLAEAEFTCH